MKLAIKHCHFFTALSWHQTSNCGTKKKKTKAKKQTSIESSNGWRCTNDIYTYRTCVLSSFRYQDVHTQSYIMVLASERWLGIRMTFLISLFILAVALAAILVSQDAGRCLLTVRKVILKRPFYLKIYCVPNFKLNLIAKSCLQMYLRYYYRRRHFEEKQFCNLTAGLSLLAIRNSVQMARAKMLTVVIFC